MTIFTQEDTMYYYNSANPTNMIAAFDIDWTLAYPHRYLFSSDPSDIYILPNRQNRLNELVKNGYTLVFFTNQSSRSKKEAEKKVDRISNFINKLNLPCICFIATGKDHYRKPEVGMWEKMLEFIPNVDISKSFYVGDAMGRPQDHSSDDKNFAKNIGVKSFTPEEFFDHIIPTFSKKKEMVIFVGVPGCGKSTYYNKHLKPLGYKHINQDTLKTKAKVIKAIHEALENGNCLAIDNTNPTHDGRKEYYDLAKQYNYSVVVLHMTKDGYGWNKLREKPVPTIVYHKFHKNLVVPTIENTPGKVYQITD